MFPIDIVASDVFMIHFKLIFTSARSVPNAVFISGLLFPAYTFVIGLESTACTVGVVIVDFVAVIVGSNFYQSLTL